MSIFQDSPEDTPDNNEAAPEEEPKEVLSNHNLGIAHPMFTRILNFQFSIVFRQKINCLFDKNNRYWHFIIYFNS